MRIKGSVLRVCAWILLGGVTISAQNLGDLPTAGYGPQRTNLNWNAGRLTPPLGLQDSILLPAGVEPDSFVLFENSILIGVGGPAGRYILINRTSGQVQWVVSNPTPTNFLDYVPAYANDVVLLGGATSTFFQAVQVSQGVRLWGDNSLGLTAGRNPVVLDNVAVYHGTTGMVAAEASDGTVFWRFPSTSGAEGGVLADFSDSLAFLNTPATTPWDGIGFAQAPLSLEGSSVYAVLADGSLGSFGLLDGNPNWVTGPAGSDGSQIIPAGGMVFVTDPVTGNLNALRSGDGAVLWTRLGEGIFGRPAMGLAYNQLYVFVNRNGHPVVAAYHPESGTLIWEVEDPSPVGTAPQFATLANNRVYFYNPGSGRIRVLDALTGNLLWSISKPGVRGLAAVDGQLHVLLQDRVEIFAPTNDFYMAQLADGQGASTLLSLVNPWPTAVTGLLHFVGNDGEPLFIQVQGFQFPVSSLDFSIPAYSSASVQTAGTSPLIQTGWVRGEGLLPIRGVAIYQYSQQNLILFEAGVEDSPASGLGTVFVNRVETGPAASLNTAIALANPSDETANITLDYTRRFPLAGSYQTTLTLAPGAHLARFVEEFFQSTEVVGLAGTLTIRSDIPVVATALRTQGGYQMSSYPIAIPKN